MKNYLVSVIVPVHNVKDYLPQCVESILNQTHRNIELILLDDGSTDGSSILCDKYAMQDSRVRAFHTPNRGVSSARNIAMKKAKGEYILFVDSDDWIVEDMVEYMLTHVVRVSADICVCSMVIVYSDAIYEPVRTNGEKCYSRREFMERIIEDHNCYAYPWNKLIRRELIGAITFDTSIHAAEDTLFLVELAAKEPKVIQIDAQLYYYRQRAIEANYTYSNKFFSSILAWEKIAPYYAKYAPNFMPTINMRFLSLCLHIKGRMKKDHVKDTERMRRLNGNITKNLRVVMQDSHISVIQKIKIFITYMMPLTMLKYTLFRIKKHQKRHICLQKRTA